MGQAFSLSSLLGMTEPTVACLDNFETDLLLQVMRILIASCPASVGHLICCCKTLASCAEIDEFGKARRVVARQRLFELRALADLSPKTLTPLVTQVARRLSFKAIDPEVDEPNELVLTRWSRTARPAHDDARGAALKRVLCANQTIKSVDLSVCYLTSMDAMEIAKGLQVNRTLTSLNASGNFLGGCGRRDGSFILAPEGMVCFADALIASKLTSLSLSENRLGPSGIKALAPGLATTSLTSLDVSRNGLGVDGAAELASGLAANRSLLKLDVRLNKLGPAGAKALAPGVAACASLTVLDARFNGMQPGDAGEAALQQATTGRQPFDLMLHFHYLFEQQQDNSDMSGWATSRCQAADVE